MRITPRVCTSVPSLLLYCTIIFIIIVIFIKMILLHNNNVKFSEIKLILFLFQKWSELVIIIIRVI